MQPFVCAGSLPVAILCAICFGPAGQSHRAPAVNLARCIFSCEKFTGAVWVEGPGTRLACARPELRSRPMSPRSKPSLQVHYNSRSLGLNR